MKFSEIVEQAHTLLQRTGRVTYRVLKREFALDDEGLADLKDALLFAHVQVQDEEGRGLVWVGGNAEGETAKGGTGETGGKTESENRGTGESETAIQPPISYTPTGQVPRFL